jgi:hypothetical protein
MKNVTGTLFGCIGIILILLMPVSSEPTEYSNIEEVAGLTSLFCILMFIIYIEFRSHSIFSNHKYFLNFRLSHQKIVIIEVSKFIQKWSTILPFLILLILLNLKFPLLTAELGYLIFNVQIIIGCLGGLFVLIWLTHYMSSRNSLFNPFILMLRVLTLILIIIILNLSPIFFIPTGLFFWGYMVTLNKIFAIIINVISLGVIMLCLSKTLSQVYNEKWSKG